MTTKLASATDTMGNVYTVEPAPENQSQFHWILTDSTGEIIDEEGYFTTEEAAWAAALGLFLETASNA